VVYLDILTWKLRNKKHWSRKVLFGEQFMKVPIFPLFVNKLLHFFTKPQEFKWKSLWVLPRDIRLTVSNFIKLPSKYSFKRQWKKIHNLRCSPRALLAYDHIPKSAKYGRRPFHLRRTVVEKRESLSSSFHKLWNKYEHPDFGEIFQGKIF
jgi:hypothetical protein